MSSWQFSNVWKESRLTPWKEKRKNASDEFASARMKRRRVGLRRRRSTTDGRNPRNVARVL